MHDPMTGEVERPVEGLVMPPTIAAAIVAVMKLVKQLGVDDRNQHGGYNYVSVDKFYEIIGKLMAEAGLAHLIDETASEVKEGAKGNPWLFVRYDCRFVHESGAVSPPMRRSCALPISGPQAFGAAQSYIEKQLLRQVFKVPTGEKDADNTSPEDQDAPASRSGGATAQGSPARTGTYPARQQAAPAPSEIDADLTKRYRELQSEIDASMTVPELEAVRVMPAWLSFEKLLHANRTPEIAVTTMGQLLRRIENRRDMLLQDEGMPP